MYRISWKFDGEVNQGLAYDGELDKQFDNDDTLETGMQSYVVDWHDRTNARALSGLITQS
jgi:hypothetical protein